MAEGMEKAGEVSGWQPIATAPLDEHSPSILIFNPRLLADPGFPGHPVSVSNIEYVRCGNAARDGFTHWMPLPPTPEAPHG